MARIGRRQDRRPVFGRSLYSQVIALSKGGSLFTSDNVVLAASKIDAFRDLQDATHLLQQTTDANRVAAPAAHADFGGKLCATFVAATSNFYTSNRAASAWRYLHDFTGMHLVLVGTSTADAATYWLSTAGANSGVWVLGGGTGNTGARVTTKNDAGANNVNLTAEGATPANTSTYFQWSQSQADSPQVKLWNRDVLAQTAAIASSIFTGDPSSPLVLGGRADGLGYKSFRFRALFVVPRVLTTGERYVVQRWAAAGA